MGVFRIFCKILQQITDRAPFANKRLNEVIDHSKPCLYIPLAMGQEKYADCYEWIKDELKNVDVPYIEMVKSADELAVKNMNDFGVIFIGGGNTFKLLNDLKISGAFEKVKDPAASSGASNLKRPKGRGI